MEIELSQPGSLARVGSVSQDRMRIWLELKDGRTATVDSRGDPFELQVGAVLMVRQEDSHLELAPHDLWPSSAAAEPTDTGVWVGVVRLRVEDVTVVDIGGRWLRVPTNPEVAYERGNTVEGTTVVGVTRVLDRDPIRILELPTLTDDVIEAFRLTQKEPLTFDDFGGLPGIVRRAQELIELPLKRADKLRKIGAPPIKGVLFTGPPGTGKTLLARIIASSAGATFYAISGPTVFSKWYGESEELLRRIFEDAAARAPSIIFFDEIDSVAGQRNEEAHEASKRVVAQLLTLMDGLSSDKNVTVIAATNRPQDIDVALRRPGRFDWQIDFPLPDVADREAIMRVGARHLSTTEPLPYQWVAATTPGWSAAELAAIWKEASLLAAADDRERIVLEDCLGGFERVATQRQRVALASATVQT